jgi:hypothetical protein
MIKYKKLKKEIRMSEKTINLSHYDYDKKETVSDGEISTYAVAKGMTTENMTEVLSDWMNSFSKDYGTGVEIGKQLEGKHRTLQSSVGRLCVGILVGLGKQKFTDPRNEAIVKLGQDIERMLEDGTLNKGYII